jgi:hypothetical protein
LGRLKFSAILAPGNSDGRTTELFSLVKGKIFMLEGKMFFWQLYYPRLSQGVQNNMKVDLKFLYFTPKLIRFEIETKVLCLKR